MPFSLFDPLDRLLSAPPSEARVAFLGAQAYAHRGLHGHGVVENSRAAFSAAIELGLGIELDVQSARGSVAMVFHDDRLERLTNAQGAVSAFGPDILGKIELKGVSETIPTLNEILSLVNGRAPILIEVKAKRRHVGTFCFGVRRALEGYRGPVAIMSFNPEVAAWFHQHAPRIVRGLVVTEEAETTWLKKIWGGSIRRLALWRAKPDFLAYDIRDLPSPFASQQRRRGLKVLTWTVRTGEQERRALQSADEIIFEKSDQRR